MLNQQDRVDFKLETGPDMRPGVSVLICLTSSPKPKTPNPQQTLIRQCKLTATKTREQQALRPHACWLLARLANLSNVRLENNWGVGQPADGSN